MGSNKNSQLGLGNAYNDASDVNDPVLINGITGIIKDVYAAGDQIFVVTTENGKDKLFAWGRNDNTLGVNTPSSQVPKISSPKEISLPQDITKIETMIYHVGYKFIKTDKNFYILENNPELVSDKNIDGLEGTVTHIFQNESQDYPFNFVTNEKKLFKYSKNYGVSLKASFITDLTPVISSTNDIKNILTVDYNNIYFLLTNDGKVYNWREHKKVSWTPILGYSENTDKTLSEQDKITPRLMDNVQNISQIFNMDSEFMYALTNDGKIYSWGYNNQGYLGQGHSDYSYLEEPKIINTTYPTDNLIIQNARPIIAVGNNIFYYWGSEITEENGISSYINTPQLITLDTNVVNITPAIFSWLDSIDILYENGQLKSWSYSNGFTDRNIITLK